MYYTLYFERYFCGKNNHIIFSIMFNDIDTRLQSTKNSFKIVHRMAEKIKRIISSFSVIFKLIIVTLSMDCILL